MQCMHHVPGSSYEPVSPRSVCISQSDEVSQRGSISQVIRSTVCKRGAIFTGVEYHQGSVSRHEKPRLGSQQQRGDSEAQDKVAIWP